jgi:hypothetical protein
MAYYCWWVCKEEVYNGLVQIAICMLCDLLKLHNLLQTINFEETFIDRKSGGFKNISYGLIWLSWNITNFFATKLFWMFLCSIHPRSIDQGWIFSQSISIPQCKFGEYHPLAF